MKSNEDHGIDWIRKIRHEISAKFDHDPKKLGDHYRELEKKYADRLVSNPTETTQRKDVVTK